MTFLDDLLHRPKWHADAACIDSTIDFTSKARADTTAALQVCGHCQVRVECLAWAIEVGDSHAVLGGMTPAARRQRAKRHEATP